MQFDVSSLNIPEQYTQAYYAGAIMALLDHWKPNHGISIAQAMVHFHALQELTGPVLWTELKTKYRYQYYTQMYERLIYQPYLPKSMIGGAREFIFGYYSIARRERHRRKANKERTQDIKILQQYLLEDK